MMEHNIMLTRGLLAGAMAVLVISKLKGATGIHRVKCKHMLQLI